MIGHIPKSYFPTTFKDFATATRVQGGVTGANKCILNYSQLDFLNL